MIEPSAQLGSPAASRWKPEWTVPLKGGGEIGVRRDDHCFVVMVPDANGEWQLTKHIPQPAATLICSLLASGVSL